MINFCISSGAILDVAAASGDDASLLLLIVLGCGVPKSLVPIINPHKKMVATMPPKYGEVKDVQCFSCIKI